MSFSAFLGAWLAVLKHYIIRDVLFVMCDSVVWVYDTIGARLGDSGYVYDVSQWPRPLVIDNRTITACSATWCTARLWAPTEENRFFEILKNHGTSALVDHHISLSPFHAAWLRLTGCAMHCAEPSEQRLVIGQENVTSCRWIHWL